MMKEEAVSIGRISLKVLFGVTRDMDLSPEESILLAGLGNPDKALARQQFSGRLVDLFRKNPDVKTLDDPLAEELFSDDTLCARMRSVFETYCLLDALFNGNADHIRAFFEVRQADLGGMSLKDLMLSPYPVDIECAKYYTEYSGEAVQVLPWPDYLAGRIGSKTAQRFSPV